MDFLHQHDLEMIEQRIGATFARLVETREAGDRLPRSQGLLPVHRIRAGRQFTSIRVQPQRRHVDELREEQRNVLAAGAQRRQIDGDHIGARRNRAARIRRHARKLRPRNSRIE